MSSETTRATAAPMLPVVIRSAVPSTSDGMLVVAQIDCELLQIEKAHLVIDPVSNRIALISQCGCAMHYELSGLIVGLAQTIAAAHPPAPQAALAAVH